MKEKIMFSKIAHNLAELFLFMPLIIVDSLIVIVNYYAGNSIFDSFAWVFLTFIFYMYTVIWYFIDKEEKCSKFIDSLNRSLQNELKDDLSKLQKDFKINVWLHERIALSRCMNSYLKGKINKDFLNKTKEYYIHFFKKRNSKTIKR